MEKIYKQLQLSQNDQRNFRRINSETNPPFSVVIQLMDFSVYLIFESDELQGI
jgi:hypothetical protein